MGERRSVAGALIFPNLSICRTIAGLNGDATVGEVLGHQAVRERLKQALAKLAKESTGSSTFVARAMLMEEPPSPDLREITDKGSLNQKTVLANRAALVDEMYGEAVTPRVISAR